MEIFNLAGLAVAIAQTARGAQFPLIYIKNKLINVVKYVLLQVHFINSIYNRTQNQRRLPWTPARPLRCTADNGVRQLMQMSEVGVVVEDRCVQSEKERREYDSLGVPVLPAI